MPEVDPTITFQPAEASAWATDSIVPMMAAGSSSRPPTLRGTAIRKKPACANCRAMSAGRRRASSISSARSRSME